MSIYFDYIKPVLDNSGNLLDVGCGNGTHSRITKARNIFGIDIDKNKINEYYSRERRKRAYYFFGASEKIPIQNNAIDTILCHSLLEHLEKPEKSFAEFSRVIKKNGRLIILTSNILNPFYLTNMILLLSIRKKLSSFLSTSINRTPTFYKTNYASLLNKKIKPYGFKKIKLIRGTDVPISFKNPYNFLWTYSNKLFYWKPLNIFLPIFCIIYKKI